ncbi:serine/threonine-protein kinase [Zavarzinella formosa]|uniref:serine/threonine-protein kinase n=1 Tax=Zavarzinella formosa TaxID=360055 RepID=UPI0002FBD4BB|nr:serine/threonine-protein kinase [Zavarzinella formosa]
MNRIRLESGSQPIPGWKLTELRGKGGFAEVWEAVSPDGQRCAIKFMASRNSASSIKEMKIIQAIQKLKHSSLLRMERIWSIPEYIVIAMELADGSLFDLLEAYQNEYSTAMTPDVVLHYLVSVADGLDYLNAHQHPFEGRTVGFQHADVKPSNLLLVGDTAKLADFGLCRPTSMLSQQQEKSGTLDFAAPEVHRGILADSSDQYSLAVTYFHLRTAQFPFPAITSGFKREHSYQRPAPNLAGVSREEARVLERALDLEPSRRWPNCRAMMAAMNEACGTNHQTPVPSSKYGAVMV